MTAHFDDLPVAVYDDAAHITDANVIGSLRRDANAFFKREGVPWRITIKKHKVSMVRAK
jgi:hypothetical protein